jgi:hypothetical protein
MDLELESLSGLGWATNTRLPLAHKGLSGSRVLGGVVAGQTTLLLRHSLADRGLRSTSRRVALLGILLIEGSARWSWSGGVVQRVKLSLPLGI